MIFLAIILLILLIIVLIGLTPFCYFWMGYFGGWILSISSCGPSVVTGLQMLHININTASLPIFFGTIAAIYSIFTYNRYNIDSIGKEENNEK